MNVLKEIVHNALMSLGPVQRLAMRWHSTGLNNREDSAKATYAFMRERVSVEGRDVLELGPGQTLLLLRYANQDGARSCVAVDIADYFEGRRQDQHGVRLEIYSGRAIPLESESVDVIWSNDVFEHFRYPNDMVAECFRVLRPGGTMVCRVDVRDHYQADERRFADNLRYPRWLWNAMTWNRSAFTNRLRYSEWLAIFERVGFEIIEKEPYLVQALRDEYKSRTDLQRWSEVDISARGFHAVLRRPAVR